MRGILMIYLNNAASSFPKPNQVYEAVMHCMKSCSAGPGRGSGKSSGDTSSYVNRARVLLSELFKIEDPLDIIFTLNDTYALNFAIKGALHPGDHAVISCLEHNSIIRPLMYLARFGITTSIVWTDHLGNIDIENIKKSITPSTKLVAVTYASNVTGSILPVEEIGKLCREHGILYLVDAAQAAGILPIDVQRMNISLLAFPGHKGLFGPMGTGGLYIKKGIDINEIIQGGTGTVSESPVQPGFMPDRFESGTHNVPGLAGLGAGLEFIKRFCSKG
jgi:selenocysteine lyase/cysteine desulfurase